jgi:hypothetical protein
MARSAEKVRVKHVLNSLAQIEIWIKAIRSALSGLDEETVLPISEKAAEKWEGAESPIFLSKSCPPPE